MERIEIELSEFTRRSRSVALSHTSAALTRGLEPDEQVLLHDPELGYWTATVVDLHFELEDTVYRLELGVRLTEDEASERLHPAVADAEAAALSGRVNAQQLLDLIGQMRRSQRQLDGAVSRAQHIARIR